MISDCGKFALFNNVWYEVDIIDSIRLLLWENDTPRYRQVGMYLK